MKVPTWVMIVEFDALLGATALFGFVIWSWWREREARQVESDVVPSDSTVDV